MKNIVGQTPRREDFFPRTSIINKLYRRLDSGSHIYISAPRRAGKTSIMRYLEDHPRENYTFLYISVEDIEDTEEYFEELSEELLRSKAVSRLVRTSESAKNLFEAFAERIKKVRFMGVEVETQQQERSSYSKEFEQLMRDLDTTKVTIVLLIDEFPVALERIAKLQSPDAAKEFLHLNRSIRQQAQHGIQFIYTGSIGLPNIARQLDATASINDLNMIEVPQLKRQEGQAFTEQLLKNYAVKYEEDVIGYMLDAIDWLMPFFIQLIVQMLIDSHQDTGVPLNKETVDRVMEKASNHRNNIYFESYYSRLSKTLPQEEATVAKRILSHIAQHKEAPLNAFDQEEGAQKVLEILEFDGYIHSTKDFYRFNSPILRNWWVKYARD
ncbi:MAG: AAA family ATPase [Phaeodactylibacter sp.]|nr:AAA family ATPase [Phaeodactylibacter sp.]